MHTGLLDQVHAVFSSHQFGAPKRHADFWIALAEAIDFDPGSTLMIDDSPAVLNQAQAFGIRHQLWVAQPDSSRDRMSSANIEFQAIDHLDSLLREEVQTEEAVDTKVQVQ